MKKLLLAVALSVVSATAATNERIEFCKPAAEFAGSVYDLRQQGLSLQISMSVMQEALSQAKREGFNPPKEEIDFMFDTIELVYRLPNMGYFDAFRKFGGLMSHNDIINDVQHRARQDFIDNRYRRCLNSNWK